MVPIYVLYFKSRNGEKKQSFERREERGGEMLGGTMTNGRLRNNEKD